MHSVQAPSGLKMVTMHASGGLGPKYNNGHHIFIFGRIIDDFYRDTRQGLIHPGNQVPNSHLLLI